MYILPCPQKKIPSGAIYPNQMQPKEHIKGNQIIFTDLWVSGVTMPLEFCPHTHLSPCMLYIFQTKLYLQSYFAGYNDDDLPHGQCSL